MTIPAGGYPSTSAQPVEFRLRWRTLEWWGCSLALFLNTGALFPLLLMVSSGDLGDAERAKLRLLQLPVMAITFVLLARNTGPFMILLRRSLPLVVLIGLAVLSTLWSIEPNITVRRVVGLIISGCLAGVLAIRFSPRQLLILFAGVVGFTLWLSLAAAVVAPGAAFMPGGEGFRGVYTHKNVLGWAACLGTILAIGLIVDGHSRLRRRGIRLLVISLTALILSGSGTGLISAVVGLVLFGFYGALRRTQGLSRIILILVALETIALLLLGAGFLLVPLLEALGKDATLTGRIPLWVMVDERISVKFWLGYGYQAFWTPGTYGAELIYSALQWTPPHAHNGYRDIMLSFGAVGMVAFLAMIVRAIRQGAALHCNDSKEDWIWMNVMVCVILLMNLTESNLLAQNDIQWLLMMTAIAMFGLRSRPVVH